MVPIAAIAQETTSAIRVTVVGPDGNPLAGQNVAITDTRTGSTRTGVTNESGISSQRNLNIGGPYTVVVTSETYADQTVTEVDLRLGDTYDMILQLGADVLEEIIVTAAQVQTEQLALGPASVFGLADMQEMPHINRDLRDIVRADPRIYIDYAYAGGAVHCAGANPRFNSLTIDGVRMNDLFGLNSNGYPTERQPFAYDSIEQVAVELAPFDVFYGGFTACNINAVTKSGSNEWHGSGFYDYTNDSMKGDKLEGDPIDTGDFSEKRYGFTVGGPIIKDKLWFFVAYEKLEGAELFDRVPTGSATSGRVVEGLSQAQLDEIYAIAQDIYQYTPGDVIKSLPVEDEKYTVKLDWEINIDHRASFTYNYNDGFSMSESDGDDDEFETSDHYYERGAELNSYTGALFSNWTPKFSTEIRVSFLDLDNRQISRAGGDFGEVQIRTYNDADGDGAFSRATVYLGTDDSRQTNFLDYEATNYKIAGNYELTDHLLTFGFERDEIEIYDLFIQHTQTENRFDEECSSSNPNGCIDAFRETRPDDIYYYNAVPDNDPSDAGVTHGYEINTAYLQDEWVLAGGDVTLVFGLRYDWYTSSDLPVANPFFLDRQGYTNADNMDGLDLLQPRFGFNWTINNDWTLRGGVGLYSGGNPNVWITNNYQNDGFRVARIRESVIERDPPPDANCGLGKDFRLDEIPLTGGGRPIYDVPQCMYDAVSSQEPNYGVDAMHPDFKVPANWKISLGTTWNFGDGYVLNADLLYTKAEDSAIIRMDSIEVTDTAPDGRPIYSFIEYDSDLNQGDRAFNDDKILTNVQGSEGESTQFSISLAKAYDSGFDWSVAYAYTDSEDVNPMTSSVTFTNYVSVSVMDPNNPGVATSNYNIPHRFTFRLGYSAYWWGDNRTNVTLFGSHSQGRPFSYNFAETDGNMFGDLLDDRHLLYVPSGPTDPLVIFADSFNQQAFFDFVDSSGLSKYGGSIAPRNEFQSDWWTHFDLRLEQEFPGFTQGHKFAAFVVIKNFCNLLNNDWCVLKEASFPRRQAIVKADISDDGTQYVFEEYIEGSGQGRITDPSLWEVRIGLTYRF
jgi:outer membrane receptor for ferrienterochelin and colicin